MLKKVLNVNVFFCYIPNFCTSILWGIKTQESHPANRGRKVQMMGGNVVIESSNKVKWKKLKILFFLNNIWK